MVINFTFFVKEMMIGDKIKLARENKGFSREYLASQLGMDLRTYEKIEHNKRDLQLSEIEKISKTLEVSASELIFGEPKLIFENCTQNASLYNSGTVNYQDFESIKAVYEDLIKALKQDIQTKNEMIELLKSGRHL